MNYSKSRLKPVLDENLDEDKLEMIKEMGKRLNEEWESFEPAVERKYIDQLTEHCYYRFLTAREWKLDDGYEMLKKCVMWRSENKIDDIGFDEVEPEFKKGKAYYHGYDKEDRLVCWVRVHEHISSTSDWEVMKKMCMWILDESNHYAKPTAPFAFVIFDLSKFSLTKNMDYKLVKFLLGMFLDYFPETLGYCVIVDSPWLFSGCWKLIRPWVDPKTAQKIKFIKANELPEYLDEELIFEELGGKLKFDFEEWFETCKLNFESRKMNGEEDVAE